MRCDGNHPGLVPPIKGEPFVHGKHCMLCWKAVNAGLSVPQMSVSISLSTRTKPCIYLGQELPSDACCPGKKPHHCSARKKVVTIGEDCKATDASGNFLCQHYETWD